VSAVLKDPDLQGSVKERERRERVANVMHDSFDFAAMGKESLGAHWASLTPAQQEEFVQLFERRTRTCRSSGRRAERSAASR
jgi:ABC-type transporter MlaC component